MAALAAVLVLACLPSAWVTAKLENVAHGKQATSSSVFEKWEPKYAVDGDTKQMPQFDENRHYSNSHYCFHSGVGETGSWWSVNLGAVFHMNNIVIYYRKKYINRFTGAKIYIANNTDPEVECAHISDTNQYPDAVIHLECDRPAQKLIIRQTEDCQKCEHDYCTGCFLELCEVQVFACSPGTTGPNCTECPPGSYGHYCSSQCGQCRDGASCHHVNGSCPSGECQPGYRGDKCHEECASGTYGQGCSGHCGHCSDGANCHPVDGSCLSGKCMPGYRELTCDAKCTSRTYGQDCSGQCGRCRDGASCHHVDGSCPSGECQPGYRGDKCDQKCEKGSYGQDCSSKCSQCRDGASCHHMDGFCPSGECQPGYREDRCDQECHNGTYGHYCSGQCGQCRDGAGCHHVNGSCPSGECQPGYRGDRCDEEVASEDLRGTLVGGAVAALAVALAAVIVLVFFLRRRHGPGTVCFERKQENAESLGQDERNGGEMSTYANVACRRHSDSTGTGEENQVEEAEALGDATPDYVNMPSFPGVAEVASPSCMPTGGLEQLIAVKKAKGVLAKEYKSVPSSHLAKHSVAKKKEHAKKNKFKGYYPYDCNRVVLEPTATDPDSHYINASFVDGFKKERMFIAAQAPIPESLPDFLRMIWQQRCSHVVMLTNLVEDSKVKSVRYWPETEGEELKCGEVTVTLTGTTEWSYCTLRLLTLTHQSGASVRVKHFHFTTWPDHGVPTHVDMLDFFWKVRASWTPDSGPLLVHCSAGVGRTGTFIALCILSDQAANQRRVDPLATLSALRHQRRNMIQTLPQYEFLHEALVRVVQLGRTAVAREDFCSHFPSKAGLLVGHRTLDQLALEISKFSDVRNMGANADEPVYSNTSFRDYLKQSVTIPSAAAARGFTLVKIWESGTEALTPTGLCNFLFEARPCALLDLHNKQGLVVEAVQAEDSSVEVDWKQPCCLGAGLTSRPVTLRGQDDVEAVLEFIDLDMSAADIPGCLATAASRLASAQLSTSSPIVILYRPSEESCAQLLCAAVNLTQSLRLDGHVELVSSLLRLHRCLDSDLLQRLAEVAYAIVRDVTSDYSND